MAGPTPSSVAGTRVPTSTPPLASGTNHQNGAVATLKDDIASINAARANAYPINRKGTGPVDYLEFLIDSDAPVWQPS